MSASRRRIGAIGGVALVAATLAVAPSARAQEASNASYEIDYAGSEAATILLATFLSIVVVACCVCCTCFYRVSLLQRELRISRANSPEEDLARGDPAQRAQHERDEGWGDIGRDGALGFQSAILQAGYASFAGSADEQSSGSGGTDGLDDGLDVEAPTPGLSSSGASAVSQRAHRPMTQEQDRTRAYQKALLKAIQKGIIVAAACVFVMVTILGPVMLIIGAVCLANDSHHKGICGPAGYRITASKCDVICEDTCSFAEDGVCDDGRFGGPARCRCVARGWVAGGGVAGWWEGGGFSECSRAVGRVLLWL
jgi:hypothetical protein